MCDMKGQDRKETWHDKRAGHKKATTEKGEKDGYERFQTAHK